MRLPPPICLFVPENIVRLWSLGRKSTRAYSTGATAVPACYSATARVLSSDPERSAGNNFKPLHADGSYKDILAAPGSFSRGKIQGSPFVMMEGNAVFKFAIKVLEDVVREALAENNLEVSDIDWLIPHQANIRIIISTAKKLGLPMEKVVATLDKHGNTSAASIPLALDVAVRDGRIQSGQHVLLEGVGGGFTWGAVLISW